MVEARAVGVRLTERRARLGSPPGSERAGEGEREALVARLRFPSAGGFFELARFSARAAAEGRIERPVTTEALLARVRLGIA